MPTYTANKQRMSDAEIAELYRVTRNATDIAIAAGVSPWKVQNIARAAGIPIRGRNERIRHLRLTDEEICRRYKAGASTTEIAKSADCSPSQVNNILRKAGVTIRRASPPRPKKRQKTRTTP